MVGKLFCKFVSETALQTILYIDWHYIMVHIGNNDVKTSDIDVIVLLQSFSCRISYSVQTYGYVCSHEFMFSRHSLADKVRVDNQISRVNFSDAFVFCT